MKMIKIPKIEGNCNSLFLVKFYRSKCRKYTLVLQEQEIAGIIVPKNTEINIDVEEYYKTTHSVNYHLPDEIEIPVFYINRMLKLVYLNKLRNGK